MPTKPFSKVRAAAIDGRAKNPFFKKTQLRRLHEELVAGSSDIQRAIRNDTGHTAAEIKVEYWLALRCLAQVYDSIDTDTELKQEYRIANSKDAPDAREAVGIVVIEPTAHTFLYSLVAALAPAIGAGNCIIVQMERSMLETPELILRLVQQALDHDTFLVSYNTVSEADLGHNHRRVIQNGSDSPFPAHHIVSETQKRVVAVVERDADIDTAAKSLVAARFGLKGKSPCAPDVVLVNEWVKKDFLGAVSRHSVALMGPAAAEARTTRSLSASGLVREVLKEGSGSVLSTSSFGSVVEVENRAEILGRKIQEPALLVHAVTSMDDAIDVATSFGRLSVAYVFTSPAAAKYICQFIDASSCFVNHLPLRILYGPVTPSGHAFNPQSLTPHDETQFTVPKSQFIEPTKNDQDLDKHILEPSPLALRKLSDEAAAGLKEMVRPKKGGDIGFFNQGIVTGGILVLSTAVSCTGLLCYYIFRLTRSAL